MKKTLLVISPGTDFTEYGEMGLAMTLLVAETGEVLASHFCSEPGYGMGDLYLNRPERTKEYATRFGEVEVKYINQTNITEEELRRRNKEWFEKESKQKVNESNTISR